MHNTNMKPMLARKWKDTTPPRGWWMSEKLDGIRAIWTGSKFISRTGKDFTPPAWFTAQMPNCILDGEFFLGRGMFQQTQSIITAKADRDWSGVRYMIFDKVDGDKFEKRMDYLQSLDIPAHCQVVEQIKCKSSSHMEEFEQSIINQGGEGIMMRRARSAYKHSRSSDLLKVKRYDDSEATVIGYEDGEGKHAGRLGTLLCKWGERVVRLGTGFTDSQRETPPTLGESVTFSFFGVTDGGAPRHPVFLNVRHAE